MHRSSAIVLAISLLVVLSAGKAHTQAGGKWAQEVTKAQWTFTDFYEDPAMGWFRQNLYRAKGILIMPLLVKMGFIGGFFAGNGVLLAQDENGTWSYPAFYNLASATFGLQAGAVGGQMLLMIMSEKGLSTFMSNKFQLGADASIGAGPAGLGAKAEIFDVYSFSRIKGLFAGLTVEGGGVTVNSEANREYYGHSPINPDDILILRKFKNKQADPLIAAVTKASVKPMSLATEPQPSETTAEAQPPEVTGQVQPSGITEREAAQQY